MSPMVRPNNYDFQRKMCRGHDAAIFTMIYLILFRGHSKGTFVEEGTGGGFIKKLSKTNRGRGNS